MIATVYKQTEKLLLENREKLRMVAEALLEKEALSYKDMEQLIGPPPFGSKTPVPSWRNLSTRKGPPYPPLQ